MSDRVLEAYSASLFEFRVTLQTICSVFIVLKLMGVITISWFWVFSPVMITVGLTLIFLILYYIQWLRHKDDEQRGMMPDGGINIVE